MVQRQRLRRLHQPSQPQSLAQQVVLCLTEVEAGVEVLPVFLEGRVVLVGELLLLPPQPQPPRSSRYPVPLRSALVKKEMLLVTTVLPNASNLKVLLL